MCHCPVGVQYAPDCVIVPEERRVFSIFSLPRGRGDGAGFCAKVLGVAQSRNLTVKVGDLGSRGG